ncbi:MAG TPA: D-sedoheptulose 7-phosphate isomerase [Syntrophobacteraceae bacterium]|nr:D-sedoheptulose 7-phosphate isomerase [Syntrophobacteraceae bacterium]
MDNALRERLLSEAEKSFHESIKVKESLCRMGFGLILDMVEMLSAAFCGAHRLFLFGNGGSAADAQHVAAEFVNRFLLERRPLPAVALTVDSSVLTSISNDYQFDDVYVKQLQALGQPGDVGLGISTSGRSPNVLKALKWARENGLHTIGWAGEDKTDMDIYCDLVLHIPSRVTARIQECHITVAHIVCQLVEERLFGSMRNAE